MWEDQDLTINIYKCEKITQNNSKITNLMLKRNVLLKDNSKRVLHIPISHIVSFCDDRLSIVNSGSHSISFFFQD